jgi:CobQ-like glutamine amidotransferase family enzyme
MTALGVVLLYPDLLGTYGDGGNATILAQRLRWRGHDVEVITVRSGDPVPTSAEVYVVGGGEDLPQSLAARQLGQSGPLHAAVEAGAAVLAVCAGLQILGTTFVGPDGVKADGLGLVDAETIRGTGPRAVGELVVEPGPDTGLPTLTGYENHGGVTLLGPGVAPLGTVRQGVGNGTPMPGGVTDGGATDGSAKDAGATDSSARSGRAAGCRAADGGSAEGWATDGFVAGRVVGTYLHGPALARNPALADFLLSSVLGPLEPLDDADSEELRRERLQAASTSGPAGRWRKFLRR